MAQGTESVFHQGRRKVVLRKNEQAGTVGGRLCRIEWDGPGSLEGYGHLDWTVCTAPGRFDREGWGTMSGEAEWGTELVIKLSESLPVLPDAKHIILGLSFRLYTTHGFHDNNYIKEKSQKLMIRIRNKLLGREVWSSPSLPLHHHLLTNPPLPAAL